MRHEIDLLKNGFLGRTPDCERGDSLREWIHAVVHQDEDGYVAECMEIAVITQGKTMDDVLLHLREAITLHLEREDLGSLGLSENPRVAVTCELSLEGSSRT